MIAPAGPRPFPQFSESQDEEETFHQNDLVQLFPFGLELGVDASRPILLLKDAGHQLTLPVSISPIEAGVALTQANHAAPPAGVHHFAELLMQSLGIQALQCVFVQVKGAHQFVRIYLSGHAATNSLKLRADEAMSLCLHLKIPIFATRKFIDRSRMLVADAAPGPNVQVLPQLQQRPHPYMM